MRIQAEEQAEEDNGINGDERIDYKYTDETGY
jgi:hypothetical protein